MGVGPHEGWLLRLFGAHLTQGFGHTAYQVGSSLGKKARYRDVDVRLMLPDDEYAAYFGNPLTAEHDGPKLMVWNFAWTTLGRKLTRLPIDFQIQQTTLANDEFDGVRSALIILSSEIPCVLDASVGLHDQSPSAGGTRCPLSSSRPARWLPSPSTPTTPRH